MKPPKIVAMTTTTHTETILQFPTRRTGPAGPIGIAADGTAALAPWRIEVFSPEDGYPARLWVSVDAELTASDAITLAEQLVNYADTL